jgi:hypothetical protein
MERVKKGKTVPVPSIEAYRGSTGAAPPLTLTLSTRWRRVVHLKHLATLPLRKKPLLPIE